MATLVAARPADLQIPRLTAANYRVWNELVVEALEGRGVWKYAEGLIEEPKEEGQR